MSEIRSCFGVTFNLWPNSSLVSQDQTMCCCLLKILHWSELSAKFPQIVMICVNRYPSLYVVGLKHILAKTGISQKIRNILLQNILITYVFVRVCRASWYASKYILSLEIGEDCSRNDIQRKSTLSHMAGLTLALVCAGLLVVIQWEAWVRAWEGRPASGDTVRGVSESLRGQAC